jgi:hypothetical protein
MPRPLSNYDVLFATLRLGAVVERAVDAGLLVMGDQGSGIFSTPACRCFFLIENHRGGQSPGIEFF